MVFHSVSICCNIPSGIVVAIRGVCGDIESPWGLDMHSRGWRLLEEGRRRREDGLVGEIWACWRISCDSCHSDGYAWCLILWIFDVIVLAVSAKSDAVMKYRSWLRISCDSRHSDGYALWLILWIFVYLM